MGAVNEPSSSSKLPVLSTSTVSYVMYPDGMSPPPFATAKNLKEIQKNKYKSISDSISKNYKLSKYHFQYNLYLLLQVYIPHKVWLQQNSVHNALPWLLHAFQFDDYSKVSALVHSRMFVSVQVIF